VYFSEGHARLHYNSFHSMGGASKPSPVRNLIDAAEADDEKVVKSLLSKGAKVDGSVPGGWTALHGATNKGHDKMVKFLLKNGATVDITTTSLETPLHIASRSGMLGCAKALVKNGASFDAVCKKGNKTPLDMASMRGNTDIEKYLKGKAIKDSAKFNKKKKKSVTKTSSMIPAFVPLLVIFIFLTFLLNMLS